MLARIRYWLWWLGFTKDVCPWHGTELMAHGFFPWVRYTCSVDGCRMNKVAEEIRVGRS